MRVARAAVGAPGLQVELQAAVVAVAGVDGPVAAGLALGEAVPHGAAAGEVGGRDLGADLHDAVDRLAEHGRLVDLADRDLAVAEEDLVDDVAQTGAALLDDLALAGGHGGVLALDRVEGDRLAVDLLLLDLDVGEDDLLAALETLARAEVDLVALVDLHPDGLEGVGDGRDGERALLGLAAGDDQGHLLRRGDLQGRAGAVQVATAGEREVGVAEAAADLGEGGVDVGGVDPVGLLLAVDLEGQRLGVLHGDRAAVLDRLVALGRHQVALAQLDALGREHVGDGLTGGGDLAGLAVDGERHGAGQGGVAQGGAGDGQDHRGDESDHDRAAAGEGGDGAAHTSPNVVLSEPRASARTRVADRGRWPPDGGRGGCQSAWWTGWERRRNLSIPAVEYPGKQGSGRRAKSTSTNVSRLSPGSRPPRDGSSGGLSRR